MNNDQFKDMTSILNYGLGSQNRLADLNKLVSQRIKTADYSEMQELFEEVISIAKDQDVKHLAQKEQRLDELQGSFSAMRIELIKEANLLQALRDANDAYVGQLEKDIQEAQAYLKGPATGDPQDARARGDVLRKRIQELLTTKAVGESFSEQIKLTEVNLFAMADRLWNVLMNLLPLLRGRISAQTARLLMKEMQKMGAIVLK